MKLRDMPKAEILLRAFISIMTGVLAIVFLSPFSEGRAVFDITIGATGLLLGWFMIARIILDW